jgi:hypothetical protein
MDSLFYDIVLRDHFVAVLNCTLQPSQRSESKHIFIQNLDVHMSPYAIN